MLFDVWGSDTLIHWAGWAMVFIGLIVLNEVGRRTKLGAAIIFGVAPLAMTIYCVAIAVGVAFFVLFSNRYVNLFNTYTLLIIVGTIKYIPFASRASLNSMLQLSGEIEEAAIIQDIPWVRRMTRIIIPIHDINDFIF